MEVFQKDVKKFREYCLDVEEFAEGVSFLDQVWALPQYSGPIGDSHQ